MTSSGTDLAGAGTCFIIQRRTGVVLFVLTSSTAVINLTIGVFLRDYGFLPTLLNRAVMPLVILSALFLLSAFVDHPRMRNHQVIAILLAGYVTKVFTEPGIMTAELMILYGAVLGFQSGFFSDHFYLRVSIASTIYLLSIAMNTFILRSIPILFSLPTIIFSLSAIVLFWSVFSEEIKRYLVRTRQLSTELTETKIEFEGEIREKNRLLEQQLTEKIVLEGELKKALAEKEILFREVHHRVKNNLAIVIGLLRLQEKRAGSEESRSFIVKNIGRIQAMATVHEMVYQNRDLSSLDLSDYIRKIIREVVIIHDVMSSVTVDISVESIEVNLDVAITFGLILQECVTNSITHGFRDKKEDRRIGVSGVKVPDDGYLFEISDNGSGFQGDVSKADPDSWFGVWLVNTLAEGQLRGSAECRHDDGTVWTIRFAVA